ncbi:transmembrane protein 145-like, partial [Oppia nitens]|uniref:transmembrane protein 145-like n=1 Tax=Oppia nitens TaxID=1686743 RepID=UPI0023DCE2EC
IKIIINNNQLIFLLSIILLFIKLLLLKQLILAKLIEGEIDTKENWIFLTRFCFLSQDGVFEYDISYPKSYAPQNILLYFDSKNQWPKIYKKDKSCIEKHSLLDNDNNQIINLTEYSTNYRATHASGCKLYREQYDNGTLWYRCIHFRKFNSFRERWWFIAIDNCQSTQGLRLRYKINMTNKVDDGWLKNFSADEFYILHTDLIYTVLYYALFIASCFEAYALVSRHLYHITYKMYLVSVLTECIGITLLCIYYGIYAQKGYSDNALKLFGRSCEAISTIVFLLLLILLAKGFTVTRARLKMSTSIKIGVFMTLYIITYGILFFYEQAYFDPGEVLYLYESPFGYGLIALRLVGWGWFVYAIVFTLIRYPQKSSFFTRLFLMYSVWFISAPVVILISTFVVPKWMREKIINAVELLIAIEAHFIFFVLTRPSAANHNFPFHVRTTQIAVMEKSGQTGDGTLDHFNNYKYAPTRPQTQQSHTIFAITTAANGLSTVNTTDNYSLHNNNNNNNANKYANGSTGLPVADM